MEDLVNRRIRENIPLSTTLMGRDEAVKSGATAIFEERYGETVRVVSVEGVSRELCGGTHAERTGDIGLFKIVSEGAVGANLRRIEALTGEGALVHVQRQEREIRALAARLKTGPDQLDERVERLLRDVKEKDREIESLQAKLRSGSTTDVAGVRVLAWTGRPDQGRSPRAWPCWPGRGGVRGRPTWPGKWTPTPPRSFGNTPTRSRSGSPRAWPCIWPGGAMGFWGKAMLICVVSPDLTGPIAFRPAGSSLNSPPMLGGKGGGRPDMAQGGGSMPEKLAEALDVH